MLNNFKDFSPLFLSTSKNNFVFLQHFQKIFMQIINLARDSNLFFSESGFL